ncbi:MAG: PAS domain-containing protein, partial [Bacteroidota bacterium]|nr:PAS domain-containing protein [Bacteroidota bacterium]
MQIVEKNIKKENINNLIFNNNKLAITICNIQGKFIDVNDKTIQLCGYDKNELFKYKSSILTHPADIQKEEEKLQD